MTQHSKTAGALAKAGDALGCLFVVGTPIGNLEDITLRALRVLKEADAIACEDTRQTLKLLSRYDIRKRLVSYHEHNEMVRAAELVLELEQGAKIALLSDAGTPGISDPGERLVALCRRHAIPVVPIPGASALIAAISAAGIPAGEFTFAGFLPPRSSARRNALRALAEEAVRSPRTLILYEAPHRIAETLEDAAEILGNRPAALARELTKIHEEFLRGPLEILAADVRKRPPRGEITLIIAPPEDASAKPTTALSATDALPAAGAPGAGAAAQHVSLAARVRQIMAERGVDQKSALKLAARERGITRRQAYREFHLGRNR